SDPERPKEAARLAITAGAGITVSGRYVYVGTPASIFDYPATAMLVVIDITDPARPQRVGAHLVGRGPHNVAVSGHHAFLAMGEAGLEVLDISHPANPQRLGSADAAGEAKHIGVLGQHAYATESRWNADANVWHTGLRVFDVRDSSDPRRLASVSLTHEP